MEKGQIQELKLEITWLENKKALLDEHFVKEKEQLRQNVWRSLNTWNGCYFRRKFVEKS